MSKNIGTLVIDSVRPYDSVNTFAAAFADELKGGLHIVANDVSRNIMPSWYLQDGMVVSVLNSAEAGGQRASYQYNSAGDPSWEAFGAGVAIDGSNNVFSLFDGAGNLKNSFFKQAGTNEFTVANGTSHLRIFSGETSGDIHIKTVNNGSADFYLDPRNGIINIGRDQTNADVYLRAKGSLSTINMHIQSSGSGYVQLDGSVKFSSKVPEVSTHNVLYFNSSTYEVTYGAAPSGGSGVSSLSALLDVSIKDPSYGHVLVYDPSMLNDGKWRNVAPVDVSLNFASNSSVNSLYSYNIIQDASIMNSISTINWNQNNGILSYTRNNGSGGDLNSFDIRYSLAYTSFNYKTTAYTILGSDLNNIVEASGTVTVYLPTNVSSGFQATVVNAGGGIVTLSASTGAIIRATDGSLALRDRYAAASVAYKGGNVWYAFGNLK